MKSTQRQKQKRYRLLEYPTNAAENILQLMFEDKIWSGDRGAKSIVEIENLEPVEVDLRRVTFDTIG